MYLFHPRRSKVYRNARFVVDSRGRPVEGQGRLASRNRKKAAKKKPEPSATLEDLDAALEAYMAKRDAPKGIADEEAAPADDNDGGDGDDADEDADLAPDVDAGGDDDGADDGGGAAKDGVRGRGTRKYPM